MSKPIQIAVAHQRAGEEQWGSEILIVLCDDGKLWRQDFADGHQCGWYEIAPGPWKTESSSGLAKTL